jgi:hypothetical protein
MIGNSPKSDINPALAAGLHAVFLFHKDTWVLEHAEVDPRPAKASTSSNSTPSPSSVLRSFFSFVYFQFHLRRIALEKRQHSLDVAFQAERSLYD